MYDLMNNLEAESIMAVEQSQVLPAPVLEGALTAFTKKLTPLIGQQIDTTKFDPKVAAQTATKRCISCSSRTRIFSWTTSLSTIYVTLSTTSY